MKWVVVVVALGALNPPRHLEAQFVQRQSFEQDTTREVRQPIIRVGKWVTLAMAAGAATWGITANREADDRYSALERTCRDDPTRCARPSPSSAFNDSGLEQEYQDILKLDDRAKLALAAGQVAIATSVVLFILDLPKGAATENIPYTPPRLIVGPDGVRVRVLAF